VPVLSEVSIENWDPSRARSETARALARYGAGALAGVYVANDAMAGAAADAFAEAGSPVPPITGQDAELAALRRILAGRQAVTVYKPLREEAGRAAEAAVALTQGRSPGPADRRAGRSGVPAAVLDPVPVGRGDLARVVVRDGFWPVGAVCAGLERSCREAGL
jgi:D-xylose transport system substrate-binding protein